VKIEILEEGPVLYLRLGATPCLGVAPLRGNQEMLCFPEMPKVKGAEAGLRPLQVADRIRAPAARILGTCDTLHGTLSRPNHPPQAPTQILTLDVGTLQPPAGTNGRDNTQLDARRCCSRGIICERVRAPAESGAGRLFASAPPAPSATSPSELLDNGVLRLHLRLRHRNCSTTGSFEARLHETRSHHFRYSRCASRSRERTTACFFTSRLRQFPIHSYSGRASGLYAVSPSGLEFRLSLC